MTEKQLKKQQKQMMMQQQKQLEQDMQMFKADKAAIEEYQNSEQRDYKVSSKKSTARNYRDYEIYRQNAPAEMNAFGTQQSAAEHIAMRAAQIKRLQDGNRELLPGCEGLAPEMQLDTESVLKNLCRSDMAGKIASAEEMKSIADNLMAGRLWRGEENPNADDQ